MSSPTANVLHAERTQRRHLSYLFYFKHHGADSSQAQWSPSVSPQEEFFVFDQADLLDLSDDEGRLYGVLRATEGKLALRILGTCDQQMAKFPVAGDGQAWHGYPIGSLKERGPENRRGDKWHPDKKVFQKMEQAELLTTRERKRLWRGDPV